MVLLQVNTLILGHILHLLDGRLKVLKILAFEFQFLLQQSRGLLEPAPFQAVISVVSDLLHLGGLISGIFDDHLIDLAGCVDVPDVDAEVEGVDFSLGHFFELPKQRNDGLDGG